MSPNPFFQGAAFKDTALEAARSVGSVDVLVTHGPSPHLAEALRPRLHVWGHYHRAYGVHAGGQRTAPLRPVSPRDTMDDLRSELNEGKGSASCISACASTLDFSQRKKIGICCAS